MASLNLYPQFETNLMSNSKVIELHLQLKSAKTHSKNYIKSYLPWSTIFSVMVYFRTSNLNSEETTRPLWESGAKSNRGEL